MEETLRQQSGNCLRIVLIGPESTGKTTLAKKLAEVFQTLWVPEYMREYLQKKWDDKGLRCTKEDLLNIAVGQMRLENERAPEAETFLFCDTNLWELKIYSEYYYEGFCPPEIETYAHKNTYDLYFLTDIDVPWEMDDLRDRPNDRSTLFRIFEETLQQQKLPYQVLTGTVQERMEKAIRALRQMTYLKKDF